MSNFIFGEPTAVAGGDEICVHHVVYDANVHLVRVAVLHLVIWGNTGLLRKYIFVRCRDLQAYAFLYC